MEASASDGGIGRDAVALSSNDGLIVVGFQKKRLSENSGDRMVDEFDHVTHFVTGRVRAGPSL